MRILLKITKIGLILFLISNSILLFSQEEKRTIRIGIFQNQPIVSLDDNNVPQGLYVEIISKIAELESWNIEFVFNTWDGGLDQLISNNIDLMTSIARIESREKNMDFSNESLLSIWGQVYTSEHTNIETIFDLDGKTIAILENGVNGINFKELGRSFGLDMEYIECKSYDEVVLNIENGIAEAGVVNNIHGYKLEEKFKIKRSAISFSPSILVFAAPKGQNTDLLNTIDSYLSIWKDNEESPYYKALNSWIYDVETHDKLQNLWKILFIMIPLFVFFSVLLVFLKRQVNNKTKILNNTRELYKTLFERVSDAIFIYDPVTTKILEANEATSIMYGYERDELVGMSCLKLSAEVKKSSALINRIRIEDVHIPYRLHQKKDGTIIYVEIDGYAITINGTEVMFATSKNITSRIKSEEKIKALSTFPSENLNPVLRISKEGFILYANKASISLLNAWGCIKGQSIPEKWKQITHNVLEKEMKQDIEYKIDDKYLLLSFIPVSGSDYVNMYGLDISALKEAQSQKMESISQLAGGIAHNFNNVLSGIMNAVQLLQLPDRQLDEKGLSYTDIIMKSSIRAAELVTDLLSFSRKKAMSQTSTNLDSVLDESLDSLYNTLNIQTSISIQKNAEHKIILGNHIELKNLFINLGTNADYAMKPGGIIQIFTGNIIIDKIYCDSSLFDIEPGEYYKITVKDSGIGISPKNLLKIFDPFFTTKEQGEGIGLGLATVYGTIVNHKGEIKVSSKIGKGTTFHLLFPCLVEEMRFYDSADTNQGTILLVDDELYNRELGRELLENLGYKVLLAENGRESIDIFKNNYKQIDLVVMDIKMPDINGSEAYMMMKESDENCKVIFSSGYSENELIEGFLDSRYVGFIKKPYRISEIGQLIKRILKA